MLFAAGTQAVSTPKHPACTALCSSTAISTTSSTVTGDCPQHSPPCCVVRSGQHAGQCRTLERMRSRCALLYMMGRNVWGLLAAFVVACQHRRCQLCSFTCPPALLPEPHSVVRLHIQSYLKRSSQQTHLHYTSNAENWQHKPGATGQGRCVRKPPPNQPGCVDHTTHHQHSSMTKSQAGRHLGKRPAQTKSAQKHTASHPAAPDMQSLQHTCWCSKKRQQAAKR